MNRIPIIAFTAFLFSFNIPESQGHDCMDNDIFTIYI